MFVNLPKQIKLPNCTFSNLIIRYYNKNYIIENQLYTLDNYFQIQINESTYSKYIRNTEILDNVKIKINEKKYDTNFNYYNVHTNFSSNKFKINENIYFCTDPHHLNKVSSYNVVLFDKTDGKSYNWMSNEKNFILINDKVPQIIKKEWEDLAFYYSFTKKI